MPSATIISFSFNYFDISRFKPKNKNAGLLGIPYKQSVLNIPLSDKYVDVKFPIFSSEFN
jgi:hypothetical protein